MIKICFYTSDYGYGHAARDIAVIRELQRILGAEVLVKTEFPADFMRQSLPGAEVHPKRNDPGVAMKGSFIDIPETERRLEQWTYSWDGYVKEETEFCRARGVDLIISDISPQPFIVADELCIPSLGLSNFTWHYIFFELFGSTEATDMLASAYGLGSALVLPFNEGMSLFRSRREMGLVSRKITVPKKELRSMHGIGDRLLIYLGVGRSLDGSLLGQIGKMDIPDASFLVSEGLSLPPWLPSDRVVRIPQRETETQNYIAMCDLVVSKTGYSTVSEAIRGQVPMLLFHRQGYLEDKLLAGGVEALGIGREITVDEFIGGDWDVEEAIGFREAYRSLPERMVRNGNEEAVMAVREALA